MTHFLLPAVLLAAGVFAVPLGRRCTGDFVHPATLVVGAWGLSLGLFLLYLMPFHPMAPSVVAFVLAAVGLMAGGAILGHKLQPSTPDRAPRTPLPGAQAWLAIYSAAGLLGVAWYIREVVHLFGWTGFRDGGAIRQAIGSHAIPSHFLFLEFFCIAAPLLAVALTLDGGTRLRRVSWTGPAMCTAATLITTDRTQFFLIVLTIFFMFVLHRGRALAWRRLVFVTALSGVVLTSNFLVVDLWRKQTETILLPAIVNRERALTSAPGASDNRAQGGEGGQRSLPRQGADTGQPVGGETAPVADRRMALRGAGPIYLYATASYAALGQLMQQPRASTHGLYTVYPVARLLTRLRIVHGDLPPAIPPTINIMRPPGPGLAFNAYTFLYYPLMDFGWRGALAYAAIIGVLAGLAHGWLVRRRGSAVRILVGGQIASALVLSIFVNKFNDTAWWYVLAATVAPFVAARCLAFGTAKAKRHLTGADYSRSGGPS